MKIKTCTPLEHMQLIEKQNKNKGIPVQPINTLGRSFYQWLLDCGWKVHEGDLHEYLNLF